MAAETVEAEPFMSALSLPPEAASAADHPAVSEEDSVADSEDSEVDRSAEAEREAAGRA